MIVQKFSIMGQHIKRTNNLNLVADSRNFITFQFEFSAEWAGVNKSAVINTGGIDYIVIIEPDCSIKKENMPVLLDGICEVSVFGGDLRTADVCKVDIKPSGLRSGILPPPPSINIYDKILEKSINAENHAMLAENLANDIQNKASAEAKKSKESADKAQLSATNAQKTVEGFDTSVATQTQIFNKNALDKQTAVTNEGTKQVNLIVNEGATQTAAAKMEADKAAGSAVAAKTSETQADASEAEALLSQQKAQQALADLLKIIGVDIATLVGGKIPMSQIPATATQEIYSVTSEAELVGLTAQRGDLAELITMVGEVKMITKTWQLLGTSTVAADWVPWGTAYAVSAGNANTATNADNAAMINNHRMVEMRQADFDTAVKDPATYYLVTT